jgi:hypothetical protein
MHHVQTPTESFRDPGADSEDVAVELRRLCVAVIRIDRREHTGSAVEPLLTRSACRSSRARQDSCVLRSMLRMSVKPAPLLSR